MDLQMEWDDCTPTAQEGDEKWASSDRGWLRVKHPLVKPAPGDWGDYKDGIPAGNYLDYGPDHYRSGHAYCRPQHPCSECEPGNVHVVFTLPCADRHWRYFRTVKEAKEWLESMVIQRIARVEAA